MESKPKQKSTRREYLKVAGIDPQTGGSFDVLISYDRLHWIKQRGVGAVKEAGFNVPYVLQHPAGVFEGLCQDDDEPKRGVGWLCYCGVPPNDYAENGDEKPSRPNKVFLVFVTADHVAYNWRWEEIDLEDGRFPENFHVRFRKQVI